MGVDGDSEARAQSGRVMCEVPAFHHADRPLSPWLRLAHRRRLSVGQTEVPLQHLLDFELLLVLDGNPWLWVEPAGGALQLRRGSLALIPPGLVHTWGDTADTHLAVHFDLVAQPKLAPLKNMIVQDRWVTYQPAEQTPLVRWRGFGDATTPLVQHFDELDPWEQWMEELLTVCAGRNSTSLDDGDQAAVQAILLRAVRAWIRLAEVELPADDPAHRVRHLLGQIDPTQRQSVEELARQAGMSATAFRNTFHAVTGVSPRRWLEERRIELAARRLLRTNMPVAAIASEVGYPDAYHFSRVFKRQTGRSPAAYRRALRVPSS